MAATTNLDLALYPSSEWGITKYLQFITGMAGDVGTSNMQKIDAAIGDVNTTLSSLETFLSTI